MHTRSVKLVLVLLLVVCMGSALPPVGHNQPLRARFPAQ